MTNEQLAVLLRFSHDNLVDIFDRLQEDLQQNDTIECLTKTVKGKWIGEGAEPLFTLTNGGYEKKEEKSTPIILIELLAFIDGLYEKIDSLYKIEIISMDK